LLLPSFQVFTEESAQVSHGHLRLAEHISKMENPNLIGHWLHFIAGAIASSFVCILLSNNLYGAA
jgi:hypothetical protein